MDIYDQSEKEHITGKKLAGQIKQAGE